LYRKEINMEWIKTQWVKIGPVAKAVAAGVMAGFTYLVAMGTIDLSLNPIDTVADTIGNFGGFTTSEWIMFLGAIAATYGLTWWVPNKSS
jgi:hypothetical protein